MAKNDLRKARRGADIDESKRRALARIGLTAAAVYAAPMLVTLKGASAHSGPSADSSVSDASVSEPSVSGPSVSEPSVSTPSVSTPSVSSPSPSETN